MIHDLREALEEWCAARQDIFENTSSISGENAARWKRLSNAEDALMDAITASAPKGEPCAYAEIIGAKVLSVRLDKSVHCTIPLYTSPPPAAGCPDWGQIVQSLLRSMDHPFKGESSSEQAERMADDLCKKYPALHREAPAPDAVNDSAEARLREALEHYAKEYCEGWCEHDAGCAQFDHDCGGCLARRALSAGGDEAKKSEGGDTQRERAIASAQKLVDLFSWEPNEETGKMEPHLNKLYPDFNAVLTELKNDLRWIDVLPLEDECSRPSSPSADRREIVARTLMDKWPGDYAWGDDRPEPNPLAFETADAILAALDGGAGE